MLLRILTVHRVMNIMQADGPTGNKSDEEVEEFLCVKIMLKILQEKKR